MKTTIQFLLLLIITGLIHDVAQAQAQKAAPDTDGKTEKGLVVLWTTAEKDVMTKMVGIYVYNAKKQAWFDDITFIVWGPSAKLLAEDEEVQEWIRKFKEAGVTLEACIWCSNQYGVTGELKAMDIDVKGMGTQLTKYLKDSGKEVVVF